MFFFGPSSLSLFKDQKSPSPSHLEALQEHLQFHSKQTGNCRQQNKHFRVAVFTFGHNFATFLTKTVSSNRKGKLEGSKLCDSKESVHKIWIVNYWTARLNTKMQRNFELSKLCRDAGYTLALDTGNIGEPECVQGCFVAFFIQQANIRYLLSHSSGHKGFLCALWNHFNSFWLTPSH